MPLYPVNLNILNRLCLVVGGGEVAARKIDPLLLCGASVRVISPEACEKIQQLAVNGRIEWVARGYRTGDLHGAFLVFAATDNRDVQWRILQDASVDKILINSADTPEQCSFQVPATVRQGDLLLAISTGGGSPALSARIRKRLEKEFGPEYGLLVEMFSAIRGAVVGDGGSPWLHKLLFERILELDALSCIRDRDWQVLRERLTPVLPAGIDVTQLVEKIAQSAEPEKMGD